MFALQFTEYGGPTRSAALLRRLSRMQDQGRFASWYARPASMGLTGSSCRAGTHQGKPLESTGYPGYDASGVVDEVGEGVTGVVVGDDVFGLGDHTQAEYAVLNAWARKPASVDWAAAAAAVWSPKRPSGSCGCWASLRAPRFSSTVGRAGSARLRRSRRRGVRR